MDCLLADGTGRDQVAVSFTCSLRSKMEDGAARDDACREYQSSLDDLTFNSKPHINMLTILAEENLNFAKDIVAIIEAQISKAPSAEKLPVLYLVDSIVKNVGGEYLAVFAKNLITSFICVFEKVDENTRKSLFKLRSTWDDVFPLKKLYALDVRVNSVDPAWPIKPLPLTVNASIHVNPKFLKQSEETPSPRAAPPQPAAPAPAVSQSSVTQEQLIRQQLLAKQKQLLELQQKKIELELEQTKAQLAGGFVVGTPTAPAPTAAAAPPAPTAAAPAVTPKSAGPPAPMVRPWIPPQTDTKPSTRDPRLNRAGPPAPSQPKEQPPVKKDNPPTTGSPSLTPEKRGQDRSTRPEKPRIPRRDVTEDKCPSPMAKGPSSKSKHADTESHRSADGLKKDPRLRKRRPDKSSEAKGDEQKDKKRCNDKRERDDVPRGADASRSNKGKLANGTVTKHSRDEALDKAEPKTAGNARSHVRKRTRSRSRSHSPSGSPKRKDRRSPKSRGRSGSSSPGKPRRVRADKSQHSKPGRDDWQGPKKNQSESRRSKGPADERHSESRDSPRTHDGGSKETKEVAHRWRSGWEENKHMKPADSHVKPGPQRYKPYNTPTRPNTPRTPKHRLSVDANLQIPEALNSASKKDLLRRASKRLESGEISQEDFLNMAHQIKHFFQYQEEKLQRSESWDGSSDVASGKQPLLATPTPCLDEAEMTYYEHKSKLRKTQVTHRPAGDEWDGAEGPEEAEEARLGEKKGHGAAHASHQYGRERPGDRRSKERDDPRPPLGPMIEDYNHGKEFPTLKSLPGLRFRRRVDPRESGEREWNSPLTERQRYDKREEQKSGYNAPRRYGPHTESRLPDPRRLEGPAGGLVHRTCPSPTGPDTAGARFERERLSPLHQKDAADMSPVPRFESPNSEHSDDGPLGPDAASAPKSILKAAAVCGRQVANVRQHADSPGHTPPHDGSARYDGPGHVGPGWYDGGPPHHKGPERFDGPHLPHGPIRGGDGMGRFDVHPQIPGRFDGPGNQQTPMFEGPGHGGPVQHFDCLRHNMAPGPPGSGPMTFQQQQRPAHFDNQMAPNRLDGPPRFKGPMQAGPRFDVAHQGGPLHYDQQGPSRFGPQHSLQHPVRQMAPPVYDSSIPPQQNFLAPQAFLEPMNPQFHGGPVPFPAQTSNFNMQPAFNQPPAPTPTPSFFNTAGVNLQQSMNLLTNLNQPFLPPTAAPFSSQHLQGSAPENHFGQVDVNDLLSKLISTGIIKPSQPDATLPTSNEIMVPPTVSAVEEEEEEEQDVGEEDLPDLTGFKVDDMKLRFESVVTKLYSGNQCCLCSMRFTAAQTDMYADHLDWHFRQNHAGKVASKKITHRRWYYSLTDWIEFEEIADLEERAKSHFFEKENEEEVQKNQAAEKEKEFQSVKATKDQVGESCENCQEPFETYWVEEEEDWFLKDAIRVDDKNFHPSCFEDYKNTSYLDTTPSPNKLLSEHPLSAFKTEDPLTSCAAVSVNQEVESEAGAPPAVKEEELQTDVQSEETGP